MNRRVSILSILILSFACTCIIAQKKELPSNPESKQQATDEKQKGTEAYINAPPGVRVNFIAEPNQEKATDRHTQTKEFLQEKYDWGKWVRGPSLVDWLMFWATFLLALFAALTLLKIKQQIGVANRSAKAAEDAAIAAHEAVGEAQKTRESGEKTTASILEQMVLQSNAMGIAAEASQKTAGIAAQTLHVTQRAFLDTVEFVMLYFKAGDSDAKMQFYLINRGHTPATITGKRYNYVVSEMLPEIPPYEELPFHPIQVAQSKTIREVIDLKEISPAHHAALINHRLKLWFFGQYSYTDIFGAPHKFSYCHSYNLERGMFFMDDTPAYNEID